MVRRVKSKVGLTGEWVNSDVVVGDGQGWAVRRALPYARRVAPGCRGRAGTWCCASVNPDWGLPNSPN